MALGLFKIEDHMGLFDWLGNKVKGAPKPPISAPDIAVVPRVHSGPTEREIFQSPALLAGWVNRFILEPHPLENDYKLLPDEQVRKTLDITVEQRERCVREYSILRIAGVSTFIKQHYPDSFWLAFCSQVTPHLCRQMYGEAGESHVTEVAQALYSYVEGAAAKDVDRCAELYLSRVYDDSDHFYKLKLGGIGFISSEFITSTYEIFRDAYYQVTQGT